MGHWKVGRPIIKFDQCIYYYIVLSIIFISFPLKRGGGAERVQKDGAELVEVGLGTETPDEYSYQIPPVYLFQFVHFEILNFQIEKVTVPSVLVED